tara:strand:+ start:565 stop:855 length:291 start_codon:yes stop_codon:yes gene_type:complete
MGTKRVWVIEEVDVDGEVGHRQSVMEFNDITGDLIRPDARLDTSGKTEWDFVMSKLANVAGRDLRHVVNGVALMDHCLDTQHGRNHRKRGSGDNRS